MKTQKRLTHSNDSYITGYSPLPDKTIAERDKEYNDLSEIDFKKKYRKFLYSPAYIDFNDTIFNIQYNFCNNTFCKWYANPQKKYEDIKNKPSRYKFVSARSNTDETSLFCNDIPLDTSFGVVLNNYTSTISNWSIAEEIKRLININSVMDVEPEYKFHKEVCIHSDKTPFINSEFFIKKGTSVTHSTRYQCKECKKLTNILPAQDKSFNYHQQRNDILIQFAKLIMSRTPVKRICEILDIGSSTYYNKLEWLYKKCLEFNERYEKKALKDKRFDELWLNTDSLVFNLNNIKLKGKGGKNDKNAPKSEEKKLQTNLISSSDLKSGYIFRTDIGYDYSISLDDIEKDTKTYHCDHTYPFLRKNDRLKYSYCPQPPTTYDSQTETQYRIDLDTFNNRRKYVQGCHVKTQYTGMAHYFLIKNALNVNKWYFVSDDDSTIQSCIFKVFSEKFSNEYAIYFTCQYEKNLSIEMAGTEAFKQRINLTNWAKARGLKERSLWEIAKKKLIEDLDNHEFYSFKIVNGVGYPIRGDNPIKHPLPTKDEGVRLVNLISHISYVSDEDLAKLIIQVNNRSINNFFQTIRRRISILERPLVTARGDGRSYIYANYNPKYAQQIITILRTFYNFCWTTKFGDKKLTPAQRLGITDKVFDYKDIIYFR